MFGRNDNTLVRRNFVCLLLASSIALIVLDSVTAERNNDGYCIDSKSEFGVWVLDEEGEWIKTWPTCELASLNKLKWCGRNEFKRNCPVICETCPSTPCKDQAGTVKIPPKGKERTCQAIHFDYLCVKYEFAVHCPVTCNFCPYTLSPTVSPNPTTLTPTITARFKKTAQEDGKIEGGKFGLQVAAASSGDEIFTTEYRENGIDIYSYVTETSEYNLVKDLTDGTNDSTNTNLATSENGKNIIYAYTTTDGNGKVIVMRRSRDIWIQRGEFLYMPEGKIPPQLLVDISDDGSTIMVANRTAVFVYDYRNGKKKWSPRGRKGIKFTNQNGKRVLDVSLTPDGLLVAISLYPAGSIKCYKWIERKWKRHGVIDALHDGEEFFTTVTFAKNGFTLFTGISRAFQGAGAVYVYDLVETNYSKRWELRNDGIVIKGTGEDAVGRQLSVSRDGKFVAWASFTGAGVVEWNGYKWLVQNILIFSKRPRVALDSSGRYLVVGLPFADTRKGRLDFFEQPHW